MPMIYFDPRDYVIVPQETREQVAARLMSWAERYLSVFKALPYHERMDINMPHERHLPYIDDTGHIYLSMRDLRKCLRRWAKELSPSQRVILRRRCEVFRIQCDATYSGWHSARHDADYWTCDSFRA